MVAGPINGGQVYIGLLMMIYTQALSLAEIFEATDDNAFALSC